MYLSTTLLVEMPLSVIVKVEIHTYLLPMMTSNHLSGSHPEQQLPACLSQIGHLEGPLLRLD